MYMNPHRSDFSLIHDLLHQHMQHPLQKQDTLSQELELFIASERYQRLADTPTHPPLPALQILYYAATLLQQLQQQDVRVVLEQQRLHLLRIADLPLESDPLQGAFYSFVAYCARQAQDDALTLRYTQLHEQYQRIYHLDKLWLGLEEWHYDSSLSHLLSESDSSESDSSTGDSSELSKTSLPSHQQSQPPFIPPTQQGFSYRRISNTSTHRITLSILHLHQGRENRFQAALARRISLIPQRNRLELHLNLEPEKQAIPLLRHIEDALWKLRLIFDTGTVDIAPTAIHQQETSLNRLRVGFEMPLAWAQFLNTIDIDALWHALSTIVLSVESPDHA